MLAFLFVILAAAFRFVPHPFSFTPVAASLLFFGARGPRRYLWVPLVVLAGADLLLTRMVYAYAFPWDHLVSWAWYAAMLWLGAGLRNNARPLRIFGASLAAAVSFFLVSNLGVWLAWNMYPKTLAGLETCYVAGLPFFRNELAADVFFTAVFFAIPALLRILGGAHDKSPDHIAAA